MSKDITIVIVFFAVTLLSANRVVLGQKPGPIDHVAIDFMSGLVDEVSPTVVRNDVGTIRGSLYDPYLSYGPNNPWPTNHITRENRLIYHFSGSEVDPPGMFLHTTISGGSILSFFLDSAEAANKLWDNAYSHWGYTKIDSNASINPSMNCHGYSTGLNTWASIQPLLSDDYEHTNRLDHLVPGAIFANLGSINVLVHINGVNTPVFPSGVQSHSSRIDTVYCTTGPDRLVRLVEKNRVSALYEKIPLIRAQDPPNDHLMEPVDLPWLPSLYRPKP